MPLPGKFPGDGHAPLPANFILAIEATKKSRLSSPWNLKNGQKPSPGKIPAYALGRSSNKSCGVSVLQLQLSHNCLLMLTVRNKISQG